MEECQLNLEREKQISTTRAIQKWANSRNSTHCGPRWPLMGPLSGEEVGPDDEGAGEECCFSGPSKQTSLPSDGEGEPADLPRTQLHLVWTPWALSPRSTVKSASPGSELVLENGFMLATVTKSLIHKPGSQLLHLKAKDEFPNNYDHLPST